MKINLKMLFVMLVTFLGCQSLNAQVVPAAKISSDLANAKKAYSSGELYSAKKHTEKYLKQNPNSAEAQKLMAVILDEEIAQHKEAFDGESNDHPAVLEADKKSQIKTLLERGKSLLEIGEYDEATRTVETIFTLDAMNSEASKLLDRIKQQAWVKGKKEIEDGKELVDAEVNDRILIYRSEAKRAMEAGEFGAAQAALQKLLLLAPDDAEGLKLQKEIKRMQS